jgi:2-polyprenyl-3-methyl-5-hydroxy-6-metoxy-1,4-benzoquinol methylase
MDFIMPAENFDPKALADLAEKLKILSEVTTAEKYPNVNPLWEIAKDIDFIKLNLKFYGYDLARRLAAELPPRPRLHPQKVPLSWKPSTQLDLSSDWAAYWARELKIALVFHRKVWEQVYVLQILNNHDLLRPGARGIGFGCGAEPIPSYLASRGVEVTISDIPPEHQASKGWASSTQHAASLKNCHYPNLVSSEVFQERAQLIYVDMNAIPGELKNYDFCWSICALEHLGSIDKGMDFVVNSLDTLKPGGVAVHTTEFNFFDDERTIDNWVTVYPRRKDFLRLASRLKEEGHIMSDIDFDVGQGPLDRFIDLPPFAFQVSEAARALWVYEDHIKLAIDGIATTCFGMNMKKAE